MGLLWYSELIFIISYIKASTAHIRSIFIWTGMSFFIFLKGEKSLITKLSDIQIENDADRVVLLLRKIGIKQYQFAQGIGYSPGYVESVINGRAPISKTFHNRINLYLERKIKEL